jgi:uncharacterized protein with HEPN domain/predicted nucleotidyltransferase
MNTQTKQPITLDALCTRRDEILALARLYGAYKVGVVGSVARVEATPDSAFDLLVSFSEDPSLYEMSGLWQDLQESLQNEAPRSKLRGICF